MEKTRQPKQLFTGQKTGNAEQKTKKCSNMQSDGRNESERNRFE
jgi:hypothetical protein